jgi:hypothetical protein
MPASEGESDQQDGWTLNQLDATQRRGVEALKGPCTLDRPRGFPLKKDNKDSVFQPLSYSAQTEPRDVQHAQAWQLLAKAYLQVELPTTQFRFVRIVG